MLLDQGFSNCGMLTTSEWYTSPCSVVHGHSKKKSKDKKIKTYSINALT
jgi:hypothetical protein